MLELVHDAADRFLLRLGLMSRHGLTSRNRLLQKPFAAGFGSAPYAFSFPNTCWRQRNRWLAYLVGDRKVQLDSGALAE